MNEKRYYAVDYDEAYYIFDSNVIRKGRVEEEAEYSYDVFANSMSSDEVVNKLNELSKENERLKLKVNGLKSELSIWKEDANEHIQETNKLFEELQNLKNQIKIYELFLDQNDLNIEWDLFCTLNYCVNDEDTGCQTCKYMGLVDSDLDD